MYPVSEDIYERNMCCCLSTTKVKYSTVFSNTIHTVRYHGNILTWGGGEVK
jgi:hypothetical protein